MSIGLFIWTFDGVMKAIALGLFLCVCLIFALIYATCALLDWRDHRRKKKSRPNNPANEVQR